MVSPPGPNRLCTCAISPAPANTAPTQNGGELGEVICRSGVSRVGSVSQNAEDGSRGATIPVTSRLTLDTVPEASCWPVTVNRSPGPSPNLAAVAREIITCSGALADPLPYGALAGPVTAG